MHGSNPAVTANNIKQINMQTAILVHFKKKKIVHTYSQPGRPLWEKYMKKGYKMVSMVSAFNATFTHDPQYKAKK